MKLAVAVLTAGVIMAGPAKAPRQAEQAERPVQVATMCFKTGENAPPSSMTKICYYDCLGSPVAITISSTSLCPLSINR